jgi:glycosyltransferase involved in cell wall biosynthesis
VNAIVVATASLSPSTAAEADHGLHQCIDYVELARRLDAPFLDYTHVKNHGLMTTVERLARMDFRLAVRAAKLRRSRQAASVICLSERVALPLTFLLPRHVHMVVMVHHPLSRQKIAMLRVGGARRRWQSIITLSDAEAVRLRDVLNLPAGRVTALQTPADTRFFDPAHVSESVASGMHIESLGISHRDYPTLIRAMRRLPHIMCQIRVGSHWAQGDGGISPADLPTNVRLEPFVHPRDLRACYVASRFIVIPLQPGTQWCAGSSTIREAQAMGKAVIATSSPGLREYIEDGVTGLLVQPGDDRGLEQAIDYLWNRPEVATAMGRLARERVLDQHSIEHWLDQLEHYARGKSALAERPAHPHLTHASKAAHDA